MMKESDNIDPSVEEGHGLNGASGDTDDEAAAAVAVAREPSSDGASDMKGREEEDQSETNGTYPADCYSFLAIHGPIKSPVFFTFGFTVWLFQVQTIVFVLC